ncbi:hypothetical protein TWF281_001770 [Arthrobotrys megalospora]
MNSRSQPSVLGVPGGGWSRTRTSQREGRGDQSPDIETSGTGGSNSNELSADVEILPRAHAITPDQNEIPLHLRRASNENALGPEFYLHDFVALTDCLVELSPAYHPTNMQKLSISEIAGPYMPTQENENSALSNVYRREGIAPFVLRSPKSTVFQNRVEKAFTYRSLIQTLRILRHPNLHDHPNFVQILQVLWEPEKLSEGFFNCGFVMETGIGPLSWYLEAFGDKITYAEIRHIIFDVALGLQALQRNSYIYGDVSMESIVVCFRPCDHLADVNHPCWAMAKLYEFHDSMSIAQGYESCLIHTTPLYAAPEARMILHTSALAFTDVYSLGILIWRLVNRGKDPVWLISTSSPTVEEQFEVFEELKRDDILRGEILLQLETLDLQPDELVEVEKMIRLTVQSITHKRNLNRIVELLAEKVNHECAYIENMVKKATKRDAPPPPWAEINRLHRGIETWPLGSAYFKNDAGFPRQVLWQLRQEIRSLAQVENPPHDSPRSYMPYNRGLRTERRDRASLEYAQMCSANTETTIRKNYKLKAWSWLIPPAKRSSSLARAIAVALHSDWKHEIPSPCALSDYDPEWLYEAATNQCLRALNKLKYLKDPRLETCRREHFRRHWNRIFCLGFMPEIGEIILGDRDISPEYAESFSLGNDLCSYGAAVGGNLPIIKHIVENEQVRARSEPKIHEDLQDFFERQMFLACKLKHWHVARYLLDYIVNPDIWWRCEEGPLHHLALCLDEDTEALSLARLFIEKGANINTLSLPDPLVVNDVEALESCLMQRKITTGTPLHWAVYSSNEDMVSLYLEFDANPIALNKNNETPIHVAVKFHRYRILELLLTKVQELGLTIDQLEGAYLTEGIFLTALELCGRPLDLYYMNEGYRPDYLVETLLLLFEYGFMVSNEELWRKVDMGALGFCDNGKWESFRREWVKISSQSRNHQ